MATSTSILVPLFIRPNATAIAPSDGGNPTVVDRVGEPGWDVMSVSGRSSIIRGEERVVAVNVAPTETPDYMADR